MLLSCGTDALGAVSRECLHQESKWTVQVVSGRQNAMSEEIDPQVFVQHIRQLSEQRDQQDAERVKKLEEDLIQGRSERLARRAGGFERSNVFSVPC